jgi:hypothetical protein
MEKLRTTEKRKITMAWWRSLSLKTKMFLAETYCFVSNYNNLTGREI